MSESNGFLCKYICNSMPIMEWKCKNCTPFSSFYEKWLQIFKFLKFSIDKSHFLRKLSKLRLFWGKYHQFSLNYMVLCTFTLRKSALVSKKLKFEVWAQSSYFQELSTFKNECLNLMGFFANIYVIPCQ